MASWKDNVRVATTENLSPFPHAGLKPVDGVALNEGDRVLVKDQTNAAENGIWLAARGGGWTRATDANTDALVTPDMVVRVSEGATNAHTEWVLTTQNPIVVGTTALYFAQSDLLRSNQYHELEVVRTGSIVDGDIFSITNGLEPGRTDDPNAYLGASVAGYSVMCMGIHGKNGNGTGQNPAVGAGLWGESDNGFGVYAGSATNCGAWVQSGGDPQLVIDHVGSSGNPALWLMQDGNKKAYLWWDQTRNVLNLGTATTNPVLTIMDNGNVGIGTAAPSAKLQVTGDVAVTGDILLINEDCAEDFAVSGAAAVEPGTVMVIDQAGALEPSCRAYDRRVAGVISGAGSLRPGIILGRRESEGNRVPIALVGKVGCKVDATYSAVEVGDILTTSPTPGHAMKATDQAQAFGAVIGKALARLESGAGIIPILVALQ